MPAVYLWLVTVACEQRCVCVVGDHAVWLVTVACGQGAVGAACACSSASCAHVSRLLLMRLAGSTAGRGPCWCGSMPLALHCSQGPRMPQNRALTSGGSPCGAPCEVLRPGNTPQALAGSR